MPLTVLPSRQSFGNKIGEAFGTGLEALAQSKLDSMARRQQKAQSEKALGSLEGISPEMARDLAPLINNKEFIKEALGNVRENNFINAQKNKKPIEGEEDEFSGIIARNPEQAFKLAKERAAIKQTAYQNIAKENEPWKKSFEKQKEYVKAVDRPLKELTDLFLGKSNLEGEVASGISAGGLFPNALGNEATQKADQLINEIVSIKAEGFGGHNLTKAKKDLAASTKLSLIQRRPVQLSILKTLNDEVSKMKNEFKIESDILKENNGKQVGNMREAIESRYNQDKKEKKQISEEVLKKLPDPKSQIPGKLFRVPQVGIIVKSNGKEWEVAE